jgi:hypothetical protein
MIMFHTVPRLLRAIVFVILNFSALDASRITRYMYKYHDMSEGGGWGGDLENRNLLVPKRRTRILTPDRKNGLNRPYSHKPRYKNVGN